MTVQLPWPCPSAPPPPFSSSASSSHPGLLSIIHSGKFKLCLQQSSAPRCALPGYIDKNWCRAGSSFPSAGNLTVASAQPFQTPHLAGVQDPVVALFSFSMEQLLFPFTFCFMFCPSSPLDPELLEGGPGWLSSIGTESSGPSG